MKTWLVAKREYLENLRTKTFWIGILMVPVILVLMTAVSVFLQKSKDVRRYAVIDHSGWVLSAVEERAGYHDKYRLMRHLREVAREGERAVAKLPAVLQAAARQVESLGDDQLRTLARLQAATERAVLESGRLEELMESISEEQVREGLQVAGYYASLGPKKARELGVRLDRGRYERIDVPDVADPETWARDHLDGRGSGLFAYFVINEDPVATDEGARYVSNNRTDQDLRSWFSDVATDVVRELRFEREGVDGETAARLQERFSFEERAVDEGAEREVEAQDYVRQVAPGVFTYLLWVAVFSIANMLMTNTIEEKSNRIIEVLLSSVSPLQLMTGKTLGIALTGLTMVGSWVLFFLLGVMLLPRLVSLPDSLDLGLLIGDPTFLGSFIFYFLAGYLLYAAILVGLGSACNSLKEAQNFMGPVMILMIIPLAALVPVSQDPNGTLARVLSWFPPFTPFVMMNRAAGPPAAWEYVGTTVLLLGAIVLAFWVAAKIFRIGVLMTGKPPSPLEILRWVRAPVGTLPDTEKR